MTAFSFAWDSRQLNAFADRKVERALASALSKSGSKAIRSLKVQSNREVRERKRLKVKLVNESLPLDFPRPSKELNDLIWRLRVSGKAIPLASFPNREYGSKKGQRGGVSVALNAQGPRTLIQGAFLARMDSGHVGIFRRRGARRLPIDEAFGPTLAALFKDRGFVPGVMFAAQTVFGREFERLLPVELAKIKP